MTEQKTIAVYVEEAVYAAVESVAARRNMPVNQLVVEYLRSLRDEQVAHAERARRLDDLFRIANARSQTEGIQAILTVITMRSRREEDDNTRVIPNFTKCFVDDLHANCVRSRIPKNRCCPRRASLSQP